MSNIKKSNSHALSYLKKTSRVLKIAKVAGTVFGATLIAVNPWLSTQPWAAESSIPNTVLLIGITLTVFGSIVLIFVDETAPEILAENLELEAEKAKLTKRFLDYDRYQNHLLARLSVNAQVRELVETAVLEGENSYEMLARHASVIVSIFVERRNVLFGIGDEYWNFAVYRHDPTSDKLICIACRRENSEDEKADHREWARGEGHVGLCFDRATEIIFSDATKPELQSVLEASGSNERKYDSSRYVSLASIPISSDGDKPLGVLIATSNQSGRFKNDSERDEEEWENADTLRDVASSLAIIFQLIHCTNNRGDNQNDNIEPNP
jgi:hypothetical protein